MDCRLEQPEKASSPISVTELGIVTNFKSVLSLKAEFSILVTESDITIVSMINLRKMVIRLASIYPLFLPANSDA